MRLATSKDGFTWTLTSHTPIISPDRPWKKSHVYVGFYAQVEEEHRIYYGLRNGWLWGREAIGLSTLRLSRK